MKLTRLILIPATGSLPAPFLVIDAEGVVVDRGELTLDGAAAPEVMRTVAVTPGADVLVRWVDLPPGGAAQARAAATWMLRDQVAGAPDRLWTVLGPPSAPGEPRLIAVVSASLIEAWTDYLAALGVSAAVMVPDVLTLPEPMLEDTLTAVSFGDGVALRGRRFAATVQPDLVDLVAAGRSVAAVQDPAVVERALIEAGRAPVINLLDTGRRERTAAGGWRRAAVLAALPTARGPRPWPLFRRRRPTWPLTLTLSRPCAEGWRQRRRRAGSAAWPPPSSQRSRGSRAPNSTF